VQANSVDIRQRIRDRLAPRQVHTSYARHENLLPLIDLLSILITFRPPSARRNFYSGY
jgi:hypothetical protein